MAFSVGSVCSGIEAASIAWKPLGMKFEWFSEIAAFPSSILKAKYPSIPNLGDMNDIPNALQSRQVVAPDIICGGTPCQAFSLAGWKNGLNDERGNLTLKFVDIVNANDSIRENDDRASTIVFWENVEGVLKDKTNAFGCFISALAGLPTILEYTKWPNAGILRGLKRNVAWRVLDAKYFGLPQQRKRLYLVAGGKEFRPETIIFEKHINELSDYPFSELSFSKEGHIYEVFREYTDCLYSAYGTKWNGNAAATNGSLFVVQDGRIRRFSPLECERLMGLPDNYTDLPNAKKTNRYQAIGNSWAVPVIKWIGQRIINTEIKQLEFDKKKLLFNRVLTDFNDGSEFYNLGKDVIEINESMMINCTSVPEKSIFSTLNEVVSPDAHESIYITPVGCYGIIRRKQERNLSINSRLERVLIEISAEMDSKEIEKRSRVQKRGRFCNDINDTTNIKVSRDGLDKENLQLTLFDFTSVLV
jgi:DNA (cytosine-5)-methyltransferase 1